MPRAFDDRDKQVIRQSLLEAGERLFGRYGLRKTRVEEITREAGVSKGSFYAFFESKELLFFTILEKIQEEQRGTMLRLATQGEGTAADRLERIMRYGLEMLESYPMLRAMIDGEELAHLLRRVPPERIEAEYKGDEELLRRVVAEGGVELAVEPQLATGLMRAVFFVAIHAGEIAPGADRALMDAFVRLLAHALLR